MAPMLSKTPRSKTLFWTGVGCPRHACALSSSAPFHRSERNRLNCLADLSYEIRLEAETASGFSQRELDRIKRSDDLGFLNNDELAARHAFKRFLPLSVGLEFFFEYVSSK
jgi:hypothetical protein